MIMNIKGEVMFKNLFKKSKVNDHARDYSNVIITDKSDFSLLEAYKTTRTNLTYSLMNSEDKCKKIIFTSSIPSEGKTVSCINTAIAFGMAGSKVLVIDADLRKPKLHVCLNLSNETGLTNYIVGMEKTSDVIQTTEYGIDCITAGHIPPNPSELLASPKMNELFIETSEKYDYIFIDMPPATIVTDPVSLSKYVTGVVLVVRQNYTNKDYLDKAVSNLKFANANILGILLNDVETSDRYYLSRYRYKRYSYKYRYYE
ncbi:MAG: CpsD/CapB family tyrosine-protein kinase [Ruminococcaceae bacterium]|nr:CpsD/CapB family tyrosine-protein kinase [Oscillospiraceae bacterium]